MPPRFRSFLPLLLVMVLGLIGLGAAFYLVSPKGPVARVSGVGGPFRLIAADGRSVTDADFKGHPYLLFFGYTHCPDICPTDLFEISQIFKSMGADAKVKALFVTVDPERDTTAVLKDYMANFDPRIIAASGDAGQTEAIEKAFRVYAKKAPVQDGDYLYDHTAIVYLMDRDGRFVNGFDLSRPPEDAAKELAQYL